MRVPRSVALVTAALLAGACGSPASPTDGGAPSPSASGPQDPGPNDTEPNDTAPEDPGAREPDPPADQPEATPTPTVPPAPDAAAAYELVEGETGAAAKRAAADLAQALTTYEPGETLSEVVAGVTGDAELAAHLEEAAAPLFHEDAWSRGEIVYPQLGGLEAEDAAVITVVRQQVGYPDGSTTDETRVLDVRVDLDDDGHWRVVELASAGGDPVARPDDLSEAAAAVLDDDRIELPDTARWDVHRGAVDESLLTLMARIAERTPYGVIVLETGHSREVFGTTRTSRHAEGRAVDIYLVADRLVIEDRASGSATHDLVRWLYDQPELSEVGSPWALDGFGGRSFSDELHQDHLHVGVLRPGEEQRSAPTG